MKLLTSLLLKFAMIAVILEIVLLLLSGLTFGSILWIALAVTLLEFFIGDLFLLPATNNMVATIVDIGSALVVIYLFNFLYQVEIPFLSALVAAVVIGVGEWFYHKFIDRKVEDDIFSDNDMDMD